MLHFLTAKNHGHHFIFFKSVRGTDPTFIKPDEGIGPYVLFYSPLGERAIHFINYHACWE